jgi:hypothetical protein
VSDVLDIALGAALGGLGYRRYRAFVEKPPARGSA